jgi:hypothetical protein
MWGNWNLVCCWWKCKIVQPLWKKFWHFFKNLNRTTIWPRNCTYECISKELKTGTRRDICTPMFHSHIAHNGQKCPWRCWGCGLVVKCLPSVHTLGLIPSTAKKKVPWQMNGCKRMCYIHTMGYYSAFKKEHMLHSHRRNTVWFQLYAVPEVVSSCRLKVRRAWRERGEWGIIAEWVQSFRSASSVNTRW